MLLVNAQAWCIVSSLSSFNIFTHLHACWEVARMRKLQILSIFFLEFFWQFVYDNWTYELRKLRPFELIKGTKYD